MICAPLIAGTNIQKASDETIEILTNEEAISVNQDKLGIQGLRISKQDSLETWYKPLDNGDWAVCFLNRNAKAKEINYNWTEQKIVDEFAKRSTDFSTINYTIRDLWSHKELGNTQTILKAVVPTHDVLMLRLTPLKK